MASTSPANGPNPTIPVLLTDLDSAVQAQNQIEITRDAGPLACFLTATNDKPRRINLNGANWQVDLKGKKIPVQVVPSSTAWETTTCVIEHGRHGLAVTTEASCCGKFDVIINSGRLARSAYRNRRETQTSTPLTGSFERRSGLCHAPR